MHVAIEVNEVISDSVVWSLRDAVQLQIVPQYIKKGRRRIYLDRLQRSVDVDGDSQGNLSPIVMSVFSRRAGTRSPAEIGGVTRPSRYAVGVIPTARRNIAMNALTVL
jgi:hypothetical protein